MTSELRPHVMHVITGLADGGAEAVLFRLVTRDTAYRHSVVSLSGPGKYGPLLEAEGIEVFSIGMSPSMPSPRRFMRLVRLVRQQRPDVIQTWMYHADLLGGLAARIAGRRTVVWGLHNTTLDPARTKRATRLVVQLNALLSRWLPARIVSCSEKGVSVHEAAGYATGKFVVVPNGYDLAAFRPDPQARARVRSELAVPDDTPFFGCVARFDQQKDHANLLAGFAAALETIPAAQLLLVGRGMTADNPALATLIEKLRLDGRVVLAGPRNDIPDVMNALDLHILASAYGEAFPNVLCEAMACGTVCVTTDVGDAGLIVGETGIVVPPSDSVALADGLTEASAMIGSDVEAGACRARIEGLFSVDRMVEGYRAVWNAVADKV